MKNHNYQITVIIPIFNSEKYLTNCIDSIINQKYDFNKVELILINDGSTDESEKICKSYSQEYKNIVYIKQENKGVSYSRNLGLKIAQGKYILFLDSDDYVSNNTINDITLFFDKNYNEIDILTYPIYHNFDGRIVEHKRYMTYYKNGTGVYDLKKNPELVQATINICIKNLPESERIYFDENQKFSEDEHFDTDMIMKKEKIGFVKTAAYYWRKHISSTNNNASNPLYCFEKLTEYYETIFEKYKLNGAVPNYIQQLFLNTVYWRTMSDQFLPYYYAEEDLKKSINRINILIKQLSVEQIVYNKTISIYTKLKLLEIKNCKTNVDYINNYFCIKCESYFLYKRKKILIDVKRFKYNNNNLEFFGIIYSPLALYKNVKFYAEIMDIQGKKIKKELNLKESNILKKRCEEYQSKIYNIDDTFNIKNIKSFEIYAIFEGIKISTNLDLSKININHKHNPYYILQKQKLIFKKNNIYYNLKNTTTNDLNAIKYNKKLLSIILINKIPIKKEIYLYDDRNDVIDNAYYQFKHDFKKDNVNRYYICNLTKQEITKLFSKKEQKYIVKYNSLKHKLLFMNSNKIFSSFIDKSVYFPFDPINYKIIKKYTNYEFIYLQHGIIHASLKGMYSKEFTEIDKFIISSDFERKNLVTKYNYNENDLIKSTMPRMKHNNFEINHKRNKKRIIFAPSWRKYLIGNIGENGKRELNEKKFLNSSYYKKINNLLKSKEFYEYLEKNKIEFILKLHPIFKQYEKYFYTNKYIKLSNSSIDIYDCDLFITDFSSFQFDFIKLKKPIIYYIPDYTEYKSGLHTYRNLDLTKEENFGETVYESNELIKEIKKIEGNKWKVQKKYLNRMDDFFYKIDDPCDYIYKSLETKKER